MNKSQNLSLEATIARSEEEKNRGRLLLDAFSWVGRISLLLAVVLSPWFFGSIENWPQQYLAWAMVIALAVWWFDTALSRESHQIFPYIFYPVVFGVVLAALQLWELPEGIASLVLGRQTEIYQSVASDLKLSPTISLSHEGTRRFLNILVVAVSALVLAARFFKTNFEIRLLLTAVTANGVLLALFGIIQKFSADRGFIYWVIELQNGGSPFGPYVNRNSGAGYLVICLACAVGLAVIVLTPKKDSGPRPIMSKELPFWRQFMFHVLLFLSDLNARKLASLIAAFVIAVGIMSTLSRGGVLAMLAAALVTLVFYGMAKRPSFSGFIFVPSILLVFAAAGALGVSDELLQRFEDVEVTSEVQFDGRIQHWTETWPAVKEMGWFGAGVGSYEGTHRIYRPALENVIFRYGESQFFQTLVELGWTGLALLLLTWGMLLYYASFMLNRGNSAVSTGVGVTGTFFVAGVVTASIFDFGIYMPANTVAAAVVAGALASQSHALATRLKDKTWLRWKTPNYIVQFFALALFAAVVVAGLSLANHARIDQLAKSYPVREFDLNHPDTQTTNQLINRLTRFVQRTPNQVGLNYLSALYIHRARLEHCADEVRQQADSIKIKPAEEQAAFAQNLWRQTSLEHVQGQIYSIQRERSSIAADRYRSQKYFQENLPFAIQALNLSRSRNILQPKNHQRLARLYAILGEAELADYHLAAAVKLAPGNRPLRRVAAMHYLWEGDQKKAAVHFRKSLELDPRQAKRMLALLTGQSGYKFPPISPQSMIDDFLPESPEIIHQYARTYLARGSEAYELALVKVDTLLEDVAPSDQSGLVLSGDVKLALGDTPSAIRQFQTALINRPSDYPTKLKLAKAFISEGKYGDAIVELEELIDADFKRARNYRALLNQTQLQAREQRDRANQLQRDEL